MRSFPHFAKDLFVRLLEGIQDLGMSVRRNAKTLQYIVLPILSFSIRYRPWHEAIILLTIMMVLDIMSYMDSGAKWGRIERVFRRTGRLTKTAADGSLTIDRENIPRAILLLHEIEGVLKI